MADKAYNKIIVNGTTLIDLTADTVSSDKVLSGFTFHDKSGETKEGSCAFDSDTSSDTAAVAEILLNKTAHARGTLLTGTMPNNGGITGSITTVAQEYTVPQGYHDGSGKVSISSVEQAKIIASNIRSGVSILGVEGSMSGSEDVNAESKTVTSSFITQTVLPGTGYNYLTQVVVNPIPMSSSENAAGGLTVTIG